MNIYLKTEVFMKSKFYSLLFIASVSLLALSCKTASKLYQKGNYDEAVELAAKKLQKDPDDPKLLNIIRNSYQYAVDDHKSRIRVHSESNNELKWEWMYNEYMALQRMYDAIYRVPSVYRIVKPIDYSSYIVTCGERAGDIRYDRGLTFLQTGDKQSYRQAYREFQSALFFKPGHRDVVQKMNEAYENAVVNVIVLPMDEFGYRFSSFNNYNNQQFSDQLLRNLQYSSGNEFVKFYSPWDARNRDIRTDMVVDMRFTNLNIGRYHDDRSTRQVSKEVVIKETVYRPDSVVKEYGKVYAQVTTTRRTMRSEGFLQINVRDENGRFVWSDNSMGDHNWSTEFATYTGDERALSESDKQLINRRQELPPHETEIIRCIMAQVDNNALWQIRNYFSRI